MKLLEGVITAFSILASNKLRSFLTMLGIVIGIAGVIAMMSFGEGAKTTSDVGGGKGRRTEHVLGCIDASGFVRTKSGCAIRASTT